MKKNGGKIVLTSTSSALHGGGEKSLAYGISKSGIISLAKALARFGAKNDIIVNTIAPGFIKTRFHTKVMKRNKNQLKERLKFIKLNVLYFFCNSLYTSYILSITKSIFVPNKFFNHWNMQYL